MKKDTLVQHPKRIQVQSENPPLVSPIYQSVKFKCEKPEDVFRDRDSWFAYQRISNPTCSQLETELAALQGTEAGLVVASGIAAITVPLLALLKSGDHVILFMESYKPARQVVRDFLNGFGVTSTLLSITALDSNLSQLDAAFISGQTKLVLFESPTNPTTRIAPIEPIVKWAQKKNVLTMLDNTFAGVHQHIDCGVDIYAHSLTKFISGHGDVMGGAILATRNLIDRIHSTAMLIGAVLDPHAAFLMLRGLKTYLIRYRTQSANALGFAQALAEHPLVASVLYPGLPSHPDHVLAKKQLTDFGAIVSVQLKPSAPRAAEMLARFKTIVFAASLGSTETLVAPSKFLFAGDLTDDERKHVQIDEHTLRFSIGLEAVEDLVRDFEQACRV